MALRDRLLARRNGVEALLADLGGKAAWRRPSEKTREPQVRMNADVSSEHWDRLYVWLVDGLLRMHAVAGRLNE